MICVRKSKAGGAWSKPIINFSTYVELLVNVAVDMIAGGGRFINFDISLEFFGEKKLIFFLFFFLFVDQILEWKTKEEKREKA